MRSTGRLFFSSVLLILTVLSSYAQNPNQPNQQQQQNQNQQFQPQQPNQPQAPVPQQFQLQLPALTPAVPTMLMAIPASSGSQVNLSWKDNASNEFGFRIERKKTGAQFIETGTTGPNAVFYADTKDLEPGSSYIYRIRAFNARGVSGYSNEVKVNVPVPPLSTKSLITGKPEAPAGKGLPEGMGAELSKGGEGATSAVLPEKSREIAGVDLLWTGEPLRVPAAPGTVKAGTFPSGAEGATAKIPEAVSSAKVAAKGESPAGSAFPIEKSREILGVDLLWTGEPARVPAAPGIMKTGALPGGAEASTATMPESVSSAKVAGKGETPAGSAFPIEKSREILGVDLIWTGGPVK